MIYIRDFSKLNKSDRTPFLKFFTADWMVGTLGLTFEQRGFYLEILIRMWDRKGPLPDDDAWLASALQCNPRTVRKLKAELAAAGKLTIRNGLISNTRMMRDLSKHGFGSNSAPIEPELGSNSARIGLELKSNTTENITKSTKHDDRQKPPIFHIPYSRRQKEKAEQLAREPERPAQGPAALPTEVDLKSLEVRLLDACNGSLDNPVNCQGLLNLAVPRMWLDSGCDLELDVIPALTAAGRKHHGKRIRSWDYFTGIVAESRAKRQAGMPAVAGPSLKPQSAFAAALERRVAKSRLEAIA